MDAPPLDLQAIAAEAVPAVDTEALRRRAERNTANADLNRAAGEAAERPDLRDKAHGLYTAEEFTLVMRFLEGRVGVLQGPVYVTGPVLVPAGVPLTLADGFLAAEGALTVEAGGRLTVRHSRSAALLPGLVTVGATAPLVVGEGARVEVEGIVAAQGLIDIREGASVQIDGAVMALAPESSLRLNNASLSVRYEPTIPGTVGFLTKGGRHRVFQLAWHEVR